MEDFSCGRLLRGKRWKTFQNIYSGPHILAAHRARRVNAGRNSYIKKRIFERGDPF